MSLAKACYDLFHENFTYVDEDAITKDLMCTICLAPIFEPIFHEFCGNIFCRSCVSNMTRCPLCRRTLFCLRVPNFLHNILNNLLVKCNSCRIEIKRERFFDHYVKECSVSCPWGCDEILLRAELEWHNCPSRGGIKVRIRSHLRNEVYELICDKPYMISDLKKKFLKYLNFREPIWTLFLFLDSRMIMADISLKDCGYSEDKWFTFVLLNHANNQLYY